MLRCATILRSAGGGKKIPNPGSSLLNPRSHRFRLREMMAKHQAQFDKFEEQAMFADIAGSGSSSKRPPLPRSKKQRKQEQVIGRIGRDVAEKAKYMTDSEWESVSLDDKHAFTRFMSKTLKEKPTETTEQQRRRYFETTMADPRDLDPISTVQDEYERIKLGLPVKLSNPQRSLGVTEALYQAGDPSLFEPENAHKLENAMIHIKQVFSDYVRKKREGVTTEEERRRLALMTAELNVETQRHLANLFKFSEQKIRRITMEEKEKELSAIASLRRAIKEKNSAQTDDHRDLQTSTEGGGDSKSNTNASSERTTLKRMRRTERLKRRISKAIGLNIDVVSSILTELKAQEDFMQFCEVFARLTLGKGFEHKPGDETLDDYTKNLRQLYSMDASQLGTLDVVQYLAAKDNTTPVEWAKRWYERALLIPLQQTPEYQRLHEIRCEELEGLKLKKSMEAKTNPNTGAEGSMEQTTASDKESNPIVDTHEIAKQKAYSNAEMQENAVVHLVEKMFLSPDDARMASLHEKRLRYLAYLQMERQIKRARENAKLFEGVENSPQAEKCRLLYSKLLQKKKEMEDRRLLPTSPHSVSENASLNENVDHTADQNSSKSPSSLFDDTEATQLFEEIRDIVIEVIHQQKHEKQRQQKADAKMDLVSKLVKGIRGPEHKSLSKELSEIHEERKRKLAERLLGLVESDVKSEMQWLETMEDAERPPLLPLPEGMSYVSAADIQAWKEVRESDEKKLSNPFERKKRTLRSSLLGQPWRVPDRPLLFWGTGVKAVQQALENAAEDAERKRKGEPLVPPYPCPENPWGWRMKKDILDDDY